jgi:hypothetical protein
MKGMTRKISYFVVSYDENSNPKKEGIEIEIFRNGSIKRSLWENDYVSKEEEFDPSLENFQLSKWNDHNDWKVRVENNTLLLRYYKDKEERDDRYDIFIAEVKE